MVNISVAKRLIASFLVALIATATAFPQATFTVNAPTRVHVGEKFAVTYRLRNGEGTGLKVSQINGCTQIFGPAVSSSMSYSVVNGKASSSSVYDYTYTYRADKAGSYKIAEASIVVEGKRLSTRPLTLSIVPGGAGSTSASGHQQSSAPQIDDISTQSSDKGVSSSDVFVRIIMSKSSAFEQEAVECTIKLYTKYAISAFFPTKQPSFDGFLIQELDVKPALNQVEMYNGQRYMTAMLKKCIMYPQKAGKLTINSGNYDINVVQYDNVNMGLFSVQNPRERKIKVSSNSASIEIKPLPQPQPEGFSGAVGQFTANTRLVGNSFRTNDPGTLIYDITGTGNIKYIKEPAVDFPSEFELYAPKKQDKIKIEGANMTGTVEIEYTFVPQNIGDFKIGTNKFIYFDPAEKKYVTINVPGFDIKVQKGSGKATSADKKDVEQKNTDILNIVLGDKDMSKTRSFVITRWWYWGMILFLILAFAGAVAANQERLRRASDTVGTRKAKASKMARRRMRQAYNFMRAHKNDLFYEEELRALWGYLSDKLTIPVSQLSRDNIKFNLLEAGADDELSCQVIDLIDECEMARYTPAASHLKLHEIYDKSVEIIDKLDKVKPTNKVNA